MILGEAFVQTAQVLTNARKFGHLAHGKGSCLRLVLFFKLRVFDFPAVNPRTFLALD